MKISKFDEIVSLGIINLERLLLLFIVAGTVWAAGIDILGWFDSQDKMALSDLFLLFIYADIGNGWSFLSRQSNSGDPAFDYRDYSINKNDCSDY